jgi:hypothetical protein
VNVRIDLTALKGFTDQEDVCLAVLDDEDVGNRAGYFLRLGG